MKTEKEMRLDMEIVHISNVEFGSRTRIENGTLFINKEEMLNEIADPFSPPLMLILHAPANP